MNTTGHFGQNGRWLLTRSGCLKTRDGSRCLVTVVVESAALGILPVHDTISLPSDSNEPVVVHFPSKPEMPPFTVQPVNGVKWAVVARMEDVIISGDDQIQVVR